MPQDFVVFGADAGHAGPLLYCGLVEEASTAAWITGDELEIFRGKNNGSDDAEDVPGFGIAAVEPSPVGSAGKDLDLEHCLVIAIVRLCPDNSGGTALADKCGISRNPVGGERCKIGDCLDEVRLPLPVLPDEDGHPGSKFKDGA